MKKSEFIKSKIKVASMKQEEFEPIFNHENYRRIWRKPSEESIDIYKGLAVQDNRVSGSITIRQSRLPLWTLIGTAVRENWSDVQDSWDVEGSEYSADELADFLYHLLEMRGEFARLLLELANANKQSDFWWIDEEICENVRHQLQRCLDSLGESKKQ